MRALLLPALLAPAALGLSTAEPRQDPAQVDFEAQVAPLLSARCAACHGPEKHKADLRLDSFEGVLRGAWSGTEPVVLPGHADDSALILRVEDRVPGEDRMPPDGEPLTREEIARLRRWIDAGAPGPAQAAGPADEDLAPEHWAYRPPRKTTPPHVRASGWCRGDLDRFVLARLEAAGLDPSPQAERATLLRRASLDLTGLPPTLEELDRFLNDPARDAYEQAVERLLASPHYGEQQARTWLDLARYSDTNGYEKDERRSAWRWRDWVIASLNDDLPFDRFTILQLAGDLLPDATLEDRIATGFHRNTMTNAEGGVDPEEFRVAAVIDRVNTTASVWLGTTLACAQCHNHKYDPFSQRDYYRFLAFFNSTEDDGSSLAPQVVAARPEDLAALERAGQRVAALEAHLDEAWRDLDLEQARWERAARERVLQAPRWTPLELVRGENASGAALAVDAEGALVSGGSRPEREVTTLRLRAPQGLTDLRALRLVAQRAPDGSAGPGRADNGNFVLTDVSVVAATEEPAAGPSFAAATATFEQAGFPVGAAIDADASTGWAVSDGARGQAASATFELARPLALDAGGEFTLRLACESTYAGHVLARWRVEASADPGAVADARLPDDVRRALVTFPARRDKDQHALLRRHWRTRVSERGVALAAQLERARAERLAIESALPTALVMRELATPRPTHVFVRGSFLSPGDAVEPGVPAVLPPLAPEEPRNRLGLARWLVDPRNPLTARVAVNRAWQQLFGRGLVETSDDFGTRGETPSHPELLDWLAVDFVEHGWSVKHLLRTLVTSATYRQSSRSNDAQLELDPEDRLLGRAPRLRLEAEVVRDAALASSGLLDERIGGPSAFPLQPDGVWASAYSSERWRDSDAPERWRRGLYTFHKRTAPYPAFLTFDGTSRELTCTRRARTNTPLQALTLLNDPAFLEAAGALARRVLTHGGAFTLERARTAFRWVHARYPESAELQVVVDLHDAELERYRADAAAARAVGNALPRPASAGEDLDAAEVAAWTVVANALFNTDEFVTRD